MIWYDKVKHIYFRIIKVWHDCLNITRLWHINVIISLERMSYKVFKWQWNLFWLICFIFLCISYSTSVIISLLRWLHFPCLTEDRFCLKFFLHLNLTQCFWKFFNVNWFIYKFSINNYVILLCVIKYNFLFMREIKKLVKLYSYCIQCSGHKQNAWCGSVTPVPTSFKHLKFSNHLTQSFTYIF